MEINPKYLPPEQLELVEIIGLESYKKLIDAYGGCNLYVPRKDTLIRNQVNDAIKREYNGCNKNELVAKYKISDRTFYNIIHGVGKQSTSFLYNFSQLALYNAYFK
jgi:Mor family transcriptional regulator